MSGTCSIDIGSQISQICWSQISKAKSAYSRRVFAYTITEDNESTLYFRTYSYNSQTQKSCISEELASLNVEDILTTPQNRIYEYSHLQSSSSVVKHSTNQVIDYQSIHITSIKSIFQGLFCIILSSGHIALVPVEFYSTVSPHHHSSRARQQQQQQRTTAASTASNHVTQNPTTNNNVMLCVDVAILLVLDDAKGASASSPLSSSMPITACESSIASTPLNLSSKHYAPSTGIFGQQSGLVLGATTSVSTSLRLRQQSQQSQLILSIGTASGCVYFCAMVLCDLLFLCDTLLNPFATKEDITASMQFRDDDNEEIQLDENQTDIPDQQSSFSIAPVHEQQQYVLSDDELPVLTPNEQISIFSFSPELFTSLLSSPESLLLATSQSLPHVIAQQLQALSIQPHQLKKCLPDTHFDLEPVSQHPFSSALQLHTTPTSSNNPIDAIYISQHFDLYIAMRQQPHFVFNFSFRLLAQFWEAFRNFRSEQTTALNDFFDDDTEQLNMLEPDDMLQQQQQPQPQLLFSLPFTPHLATMLAVLIPSPMVGPASHQWPSLNLPQIITTSTRLASYLLRDPVDSTSQDEQESSPHHQTSLALLPANITPPILFAIIALHFVSCPTISLQVITALVPSALSLIDDHQFAVASLGSTQITTSSVSSLPAVSFHPPNIPNGLLGSSSSNRGLDNSPFSDGSQPPRLSPDDVLVIIDHRTSKLSIFLLAPSLFVPITNTTTTTTTTASQQSPQLASTVSPSHHPSLPTTDEMSQLPSLHPICLEMQHPLVSISLVYFPAMSNGTNNTNNHGLFIPEESHFSLNVRSAFVYSAKRYIVPSLLGGNFGGTVSAAALAATPAVAVAATTPSSLTTPSIGNKPVASETTPQPSSSPNIEINNLMFSTSTNDLKICLFADLVTGFLPCSDTDSGLLNRADMTDTTSPVTQFVPVPLTTVDLQRKNTLGCDISPCYFSLSCDTAQLYQLAVEQHNITTQKRVAEPMDNQPPPQHSSNSVSPAAFQLVLCLDNGQQLGAALSDIELAVNNHKSSAGTLQHPELASIIHSLRFHRSQFIPSFDDISGTLLVPLMDHQGIAAQPLSFLLE